MDPGVQLVSLQMLLVISAFIIAVTIHECAHAAVAYLLGDPTAKNAGRLTLNPLAHVDPLGLLFLIFVQIGWAAPVPIDERNFRYPRLFSVLTGLAGPASNFLLAITSLYCLHYGVPHLPTNSQQDAAAFFKAFASINTMLGVFNAIPLPPLDGSHIIRALTPRSLLPLYYTISRFSFFILIALLAFPQSYQLLVYAIESTYEFFECLVV